MVSKVSETVTATLLGKTLDIVLVNGELTVNDEPFELTPSDHKDYPVTAGWFKFKADSYLQISPTNIKVMAAVGEKMVPLPVTKPARTSVVEVLGKASTFVVADGKLTIDGKPFKLTPSDKEDYPATAGWSKYSYNSYIQISPTNIKVELLAGGKKLPVTVKKPKPVPAKSK